MLWCSRFIWLYDSWVWFCASLALHVSAWGWFLGLSRAQRVGGVAALAAFLSGLAQGADQNLPLIAWEWEHWPIPAAAIWILGASIAIRRDRYWVETFCGLLIGGIYIYEYVNPLPLNRLLIEALFGAMLLPSIGGIIGRGIRFFLLGCFGRASVRSSVSVMAEDHESMGQQKAVLRDR